MVPHLTHVIVFVDDMEGAVAYYRDTLGLPLRFSSPKWSEFETGATTLALHPASDDLPAGSVQVGLSVEDMQHYYERLTGRGVVFSTPPTQTGHGLLAQLTTPDGTSLGLSQP